MKSHHPTPAEYIKRVISPATGEYVMSYGVITTFALHPDGPAENPYMSQVWPLAMAGLGESSILDEGWPKAAGEFVAYGAAFCPAGFTEQPVSVRIRVGSLEKQLAVFGNRTINFAGTISQPKAFMRLPITAENAFGGEGYDKNPLGKAATPIISESGESVWPMPNVELPNKLMIKQSDQLEPAGFWALQQAAPQRAQHLGPFDDAWIKQRWPHLPLGTKPAFYQSAPADQQLNDYFKGDERIVIRNMHPQHAVIESALPSLRARIFVERARQNGEIEFTEYTSRAETVWLFPESLTGLILFRATLPTRDADADDLLHVYAAFESLNQSPQPIEVHYRDFLVRAGRVTLPEAAPSLATGSSEFDAEIQSEQNELKAVQAWAKS